MNVLPVRFFPKGELGIGFSGVVVLAFDGHLNKQAMPFSYFGRFHSFNALTAGGGENHIEATV